MKTTNFLVIITTLLLISSMAMRAEDWPQYLGPNRNSKTSQKGLLRSWPEQGPEVLWTVNIGRGYGGPVVKDGKVYLLDRDDKVGDILRCFSLQTGEELWKFSYDSPGEYPFPGSRSVPIVDERYIYSCGANGELYCIDINTHQPVWTKNVWKDFGGADLPLWGISQCPFIYGDLLIVASQTPQAGIVAFNKLTGDVVWQTVNLGPVGYASPATVKVDNKDQLVAISSSSRNASDGTIVGLDPLTGKILWTVGGWNSPAQVPSAVDAGDNRLLVNGELRSTMLKINRKSDNTYEATQLFTTTDFGDEIKPAVLHNGYFYAMFHSVSKREGLACMDMEGNIMWKTKRAPSFCFGSMIFADGLILATDGLTSLYLIEPDPAGFKQLSKANVLSEGGASTKGMTTMAGGTQNFAPIALADGKLLVRDQAKMVCVKVAE